jgi:hypothetical protein
MLHLMHVHLLRQPQRHRGHGPIILRGLWPHPHLLLALRASLT